jgi:ABC-type transport system substrate-binding protein
VPRHRDPDRRPGNRRDPGDYLNSQISTLAQLEHSGRVTVHLGPGWTTDAFIVTSLKGVLGSLKVRHALSLALNRQAIIGSVYDGAAVMPRWLLVGAMFGNPAAWQAQPSNPGFRAPGRARCRVRAGAGRLLWGPRCRGRRGGRG